MFNVKSIKIWTILDGNNESMGTKNKNLLENSFLKAKPADAVTIKTFYINNETVLK